MKNKKLEIIILAILILLIILIGMAFLPKSHSQSTNNSKEIHKMIDNMDNKKTFNLLIIRNSHDSYKMQKLFSYYKDTYNIKYQYLSANNDSKYAELLSDIDTNLKGKESMIFAVIKDGVTQSVIVGETSEINLKKFFIDNDLISKEYEKIDTIISANDDNYLKSKDEYCILYIDNSREKQYKYRRILVENKIPSFIMYSNNYSNKKAEEYFKKELKIEGDVDDKLPMVIQIKDGKIHNVYNKVSLEDLADKCKN